MSARQIMRLFFRLWNTVPHIPRINFALDDPGWDANSIDALTATLTYFADIFFSPLNWITVHILCAPLKSRSRSGTQPIKSRYNRLNLVISKKADAVLDPYCCRPLSAFHVLVVKSPHMRPEEIRLYSYQSTMKKLNKVTEFTRLRPPAPMRSLTPRWRPGFFGIQPSGWVYSVNNPPGCYPPDCFLHPLWTLRMTAYAPRRHRRPRLRYVSRYGHPRHDRDLS